MTHAKRAANAGGRLVPVETASVAEIAAAMRSGKPVALPTDTVYGLAARAGDHQAVARIFALKQRPVDRQIAALVADVAQAERLVELGAVGRCLADAFWPGALTIVARRRAGCELAIGDERTIGVRCPAQALVRAVAAEAGPIAATSANASGAAVLTEAAAIAEHFDSLGIVVDAGRLEGAASTVVTVVDGVEVLRQGPISAEAINAAVDTATDAAVDTATNAAGEPDAEPDA